MGGREGEGGREGGGPSWRERSQRERKGEKSFPESSLVDFSVHCFPQPAELTPNKGRRGGLYFFFKGPKESSVYKTRNATATSWQKERLKWRTDAFLIRYDANLTFTLSGRPPPTQTAAGSQAEPRRPWPLPPYFFFSVKSLSSFLFFHFLFFSFVLFFPFSYLFFFIPFLLFFSCFSSSCPFPFTHSFYSWLLVSWFPLILSCPTLYCNLSLSLSPDLLNPGNKNKYFQYSPIPTPSDLHSPSLASAPIQVSLGKRVQERRPIWDYRGFTLGPVPT